MKKILVLYHSQQYGHTEAMAKAVAEGVRAAGAAADLFNANTGRFPMEDYRYYDAAAFGTPDYFSYFAGTLKTFLDDWYLAKKADPKGLTDKPLALFLSHGGGGRAREPFRLLFERLGETTGDLVESSGRPDAEVLMACRKLGEHLAAVS